MLNKGERRTHIDLYKLSSLVQKTKVTYPGQGVPDLGIIKVGPGFYGYGGVRQSLLRSISSTKLVSVQYQCHTRYRSTVTLRLETTKI